MNNDGAVDAVKHFLSLVVNIFVAYLMVLENKQQAKLPKTVIAAIVDESADTNSVISLGTEDNQGRTSTFQKIGQFSDFIDYVEQYEPLSASMVGIFLNYKEEGNSSFHQKSLEETSLTKSNDQERLLRI